MKSAVEISICGEASRVKSIETRAKITMFLIKLSKKRWGFFLALNCVHVMTKIGKAKNVADEIFVPIARPASTPSDRSVRPAISLFTPICNDRYKIPKYRLVSSDSVVPKCAI